MLTLIVAALLTTSAQASPHAPENGAGDALIKRLEADPQDLDVLEELAELGRYADAPWWKMTYTDKIAANPRASAARRAEAVRQAGEMRLQLGDFHGAQMDFERALEAAPGDGGLLYLLALAKQERPEEALIDAERAAKAAGFSAAGRANANLLAGQLRTDIGNAAAAQASLTLALSDAPDDLDALYAMVRVLRERKSEALVFARRADDAAGRTPLWQRPAALLLSARIWLELEEHAPAAEKLLAVLRFNPEDLDALGALVRIKDKLTAKQLDDARRASLLAAAPDARVPEASNDEDALKRALADNPDDLETLRRLAVSSLQRRRRIEAAVFALRFEDAVWKTPVWQRAEANRVLAALWLDLGSRDRAWAILNRARDLKSDSIDTWRMFIALRPSERGTNLKGVYSGIYCTAAEMRMAIGDRAGATESVNLSLKQEPGHPWSLRLRAALKNRP